MARKEAVRLGTIAGQRRGCLFCRRTDRTFKSFEHIFPEGLGNVEKVLPPGVVCDTCNHEVCAPLDDALIKFPIIDIMRVTYGITSKKGAMPSTKFDNGTLTAERRGHLSLELDSRKWTTPPVPAGDGRVQWSYTSQISGFTPKKFALVHRALVKCALEFAWLDHGEEVLSDRFDRERQIVLRGGHAGYLVVPRTANVLDNISCSLTYMPVNTVADGTPLMGIEASFWGVVIATDTLFPQPTGDITGLDAVTLQFSEADHRRAQRLR